MKTIYFVRHGESEANNLGLSAGSEFDTPLTDIGRKQAQKTGQDLKDKNIQLIVSSSQGRAIETAEIIGLALTVTNEVDCLHYLFGEFYGAGLTDDVNFDSTRILHG